MGAGGCRTAESRPPVFLGAGVFLALLDDLGFGLVVLGVDVDLRGMLVCGEN